MKSELSVEQKVAFSQYRSRSPPSLLPETMRGSERNSKSSSDLNVSFGYQCNACQYTSTELDHESEHSTTIQIQDSKIKFRSSSFSCLSGAALSANATLANTNICNGLIGEEILPGLDSPTSFRRMTSSSSISRLDLMSSSSQSSMSTLSGIVSTDSDGLESCRNFWNSMSAPAGVESSSFLNAVDVQTAGGAAGEDRVQAVCSEENGWLFCGVYDGFNGRDAADFLAGTLYENIRFYLYLLECQIKQQGVSSGLYEQKYLQCSSSHKTMKSELSLAIKTSEIENRSGLSTNFSYEDFLSESFRLDVLDCLVRALAQAESDFIYMVEQEMVDRPDLVSVGSSVLAVLLHGMDLYVLNLGDSRAVLATANSSENGTLEAIQLTEIHTIDNEAEYRKVLADHPDDPSPIIGGKVKGKLKLTRALGVGYLKKVFNFVTNFLKNKRLMDAINLSFKL